MSSNKYRPKTRSKSTADTDNESQPLLSSDASRTSIVSPYSGNRGTISDAQYFARNDYESIYPVGPEPKSVITKIFVQEPSKQSSVVTIFAIWNTMMGTSLLAMPWGIERAGLVTGVALIIIMGALCLYTTHCVMKTQKLFDTLFEGTMKDVHTSVYTNISLPVICPKSEQALGEIEATKISFYYKIWDLENTVPIFLAAFITPLLSFKSATFFTKFNSFGTLSVLYITVFILIKGFSWGININVTTATSPLYSPWISSSFPATSGMLSLSYFVQNIIITVMRSNRNQENNGRDLSLAYLLVTLTYLTVGVVFYTTFPLAKGCIEDNLLNNFPSWDLLTVLARVFLFFQLVTVFPLISFMLRVQVLTTFFSTEYPSRCYVFLFNIIVVIVCILFAMFLPRIGTVIRFTGALSGFFHVFTLPCLLRVTAERKVGELSTTSLLLHILIPIIGALNLIAQFIVSDD